MTHIPDDVTLHQLQLFNFALKYLAVLIFVLIGMETALNSSGFHHSRCLIPFGTSELLQDRINCYTKAVCNVGWSSLVSGLGLNLFLCI